MAPRRRSRALTALVLVLGCSVHQRAHAGWLDPDTPKAAYTMKSLTNGEAYELVMSDEFNTAGRSFKDGDDPMWTAELHSDDAQTSAGYGSLHYYNYTHVTTNDGCMNITTSSDKTEWRGYNPFQKKYETLFKNFRSGMLTSWNKFCFTGGIIEMRAQLPGQFDIGGLWPAFWLLGNLGRATYEASTNLVWPWSFDRCDRDLQLAQEISACNGVKHFGLNAHQGRGSTEIDIIEVMPGKPGYPEIIEWDPVGLPYMSGTLQVAPGIPDHRPEMGEYSTPKDKWYEGMIYGPNTTQNFHFYGLTVDKTKPMEPVYRSAKQSYRADGISSITRLSATHFEEFHTYKLDWQPGPEGHLIWYLDDELLFEIKASTLDPHGSQIPDEPSYVIFNTAVASSWGFPIPCPPGCPCSCYDCHDNDCACSFYSGFCSSLPAYFMVDHVRVWQNSARNHTVTCDPPSHPTRLFIEAHPYRYTPDSADEPLKKIRVGGASCKRDADCDAPHGICHKGWLGSSCKCNDGWVGPRCMSPPSRFDDVTYHHDVDLTPMPAEVPYLLRGLAAAVAIAAVAATVLIGRGKSKQRAEAESDSRTPLVRGGN